MLSLIQFVFQFQEQFHLWVAFKQRWDCFLRPNTWWQAFCYSLLWNLAVSGIQLHQWCTIKLTKLINGPSTFTSPFPSKYYNNLRRTVSTIASKHKMDPKTELHLGRTFHIKRHGFLVSKRLLKKYVDHVEYFLKNTYPNIILILDPRVVWTGRS